MPVDASTFSSHEHSHCRNDKYDLPKEYAASMPALVVPNREALSCVMNVCWKNLSEVGPR